MSYDVVEQGLLTIIRKATGFDVNNTSQGDYRILAEPREQYCILTPGPIRNRTLIGAPRYISTTWITNLELFVPYIDNLTEIWEELRTTRQYLIDTLDAYPRLDSTDGVVNAFLEGAQQPEIRRGEGRRWWFQALQVTIEERENRTILE